MKKMGIEAIYRRRTLETSARAQNLSLLLRKLAVTRPNQVWAMDLTYIPMARGFVYLCAVVDWFSRKVLSWRLSITMETAFCIEAGGGGTCPSWQAGNLQYRPGIAVHLHRLHRRAEEVTVAISMDGKGAWRDCLRRAALAFDQIRGSLPPCLQDCVRGTRWHRPRYLNFYNIRRPHSSLNDRRTP